MLTLLRNELTGNQTLKRDAQHSACVAGDAVRMGLQDNVDELVANNVTGKQGFITLSSGCGACAAMRWMHAPHFAFMWALFFCE